MNDIKPGQAWYQRLFAGNNVLRLLAIILTLLIIIFMLGRVSFIFEPIWTVLGTVGAPIVVAGVLYYVLNPLKRFLMRKAKFPRGLAVASVLGILVLVVGFVLSVAIPFMRDQILSLIKSWPEIFKAIESTINSVIADDRFESVREWATETNNEFTNTLTEWGKQNLANGISGVAQFATIMTHVGLTLVVAPFMLFYLLRDGGNLPTYLAQFLPTQAQRSLLTVLSEMNQQIANYVRGQLGVALSVMIMFGIGWTIIDLPYALLLAVIAGMLNLIPYLGSFLAQIPAIIIALFVDPKMVLLVLLVVAIEQPIEGHLIAPMILGDSLKIHPITVIVVMLSAGSLFGFVGVILGIPGYAVLKVLVTHLYQWWRENSELFAEPAPVIVAEAPEETIQTEEKDD
jgi:predicted PurR-regulated permease PerM